MAGLLVLILCVRPAPAAVVSGVDLDRWVAELVPQIEALVGVRFAEKPTIEVEDRPTLTTIIEVAARKAAVSAETLDEAKEAVNTGFALYLPSQQRIYVVKETNETTFAAMINDADLLPPFLRCVVAHELVHALTDQRLHRRVDVNREDSANADEGIAQLVMQKVCTNSRAMALAEALQGVEGLSSANHDEYGTTEYGAMPRFLSLLLRDRGWEAVWAVAANPPPTAEVWAAIEPSLDPRWRDATRLDQHLVSLDHSLQSAESGHTSASRLLGKLHSGVVEPRWVVDGGEGLISRAEHRYAEAALAVVQVEDVELVRRWLTIRRTNFSLGSVMVPLEGATRMGDEFDGPVLSLVGRGYNATTYATFRTVTPPIRTEYDRGTPVCALGRGCRYREYWGMKYGVLVGLATLGLDPRPGAAARLIEAVVADYRTDGFTEFEQPSLSWPPSPPSKTTLRAEWLARWMELRMEQGRPCAGAIRLSKQVDPAELDRLRGPLSACEAR